MPSAESESLRERKKRRTREAIANAAMRLFLARGFDRVTVAEVAAAAEVSEKTVFNHFDCKEALMFDLDTSIEAELVALVKERRVGVSVIEALRGFGRADAEAASVRAQAEKRAKRGGSAERSDVAKDVTVDIERFQAIVAESPALRTYWSGLFARYENTLRDVLLAEIADGDVRGRVEAQVVAAGVVAALRLQFEVGEWPPRGRGQPMGLGLNALERGFDAWRVRRRGSPGASR